MFRRVAISVACVLFVWRSAQAGQSQDLAKVLPQLLVQNADDVHVDPGGVNHAGHFLTASEDGANALSAAFNSALVETVSAFPLGSSSGGFVFEGDPALGDFRPASRGFGSSFAERALTIGAHTMSVAFSYQRAHFTSFEGKDLANGGVTFTMHHSNCCPASNPGAYPSPAFEADLIQESVALDITTETTAMLFTYGLTRHFDVGAVVPITHVSLSATATATIDRIGTPDNPFIHRFDGPDPDHHFSTAAGSATGLGDVVLRAKYRVWPTRGGGVVAGLDLRMPTGDANNLLGLGTTQARMYAGASIERQRWSPHANVSFAVAGTSPVTGETLPKEFGYVAGAETVIGRATITGDVLGRRLIGASRFADQTVQDPLTPQGAFVTRIEFLNYRSDLIQTYAILGAKYPIAPHLLLTGSAVFSLGHAGLTATFAPVIGLEYVILRGNQR